MIYFLVSNTIPPSLSFCFSLSLSVSLSLFLRTHNLYCIITVCISFIYRERLTKCQNKFSSLRTRSMSLHRALDDMRREGERMVQRPGGEGRRQSSFRGNWQVDWTGQTIGNLLTHRYISKPLIVMLLLHKGWLLLKAL